ncbi:putative pre-mRNA splicing factor [Besnoitia besnoiti]|uniref:Pre-mRNA-splicing factor 38 n=1 Tax=Besnoitia besnoiti TaxID=94643 RepID=A0A2A9MLT9_BESBE|nr:putative pre-mRNA splicing factor [Besnoitia besnoiti]PFH36703.1 putative pre-mRNA splicing factor [Besnoitia besnoiti]
MANRTDPLARQVHGCNPQTLMSRIVRRKIYESAYWKEQCFALTAETVLDPCVALTYVGGTYGGKRQPAPFLCLVLKLLQIQPEEEVVLEFIKQEQFKYLRAVGAFYFRLVGRAHEVYTHLEPLLADYRKLRMRQPDGRYTLMCMDEFVDSCLRNTNFLDVDLPALPKREVLENEGELPPTRLTALEHDVEVYASAGVAPSGKTLSERDQQLWLLQKEKLREEQKKLQRHVLQQRMRHQQQEQEQLLMQQVRELEIENGGDRAEPEKKEEADGWWREKKEKNERSRDERDRERAKKREEREDEERERLGNTHAAGDRPTSRYAEDRARGRGRGGSRSPTPVIKREKDERRGDDDERRRRRRREEEEEVERRRRRRDEEEEDDRHRRRERWRREDEEEERRRRRRDEDGDRRRRDRKDQEEADRHGDNYARSRRQYDEFDADRRRHRGGGGRGREEEDEDQRARQGKLDRKDEPRDYDDEGRRRRQRGHEAAGGARSERDEKKPKREGDTERERDRAKGPAFSYGSKTDDRKKGKDDSLSVQEWDTLRAQLGLKPLKK